MTGRRRRVNEAVDLLRAEMRRVLSRALGKTTLDVPALLNATQEVRTLEVALTTLHRYQHLLDP